MDRIVKQAVILAGGRGERLRPFTDTLPKPMYPIEGVSFIERLILQIKSFGISDILILLGYKASKVIELLGNGEKYGVKITYDVTPVEYDTLERLMNAKSKMNDFFLLMYCDNYCPINFKKLVHNSVIHNSDIELSIYDNNDNYTKSNVLIDENGKVLLYDKQRVEKNLSGVEIGYSIVNKKIFDNLEFDGKNFSKTVFPKLVLKGSLYATITHHRYYSIGSFNRMNLTEEFFNKKRVVFLDRDGTINKRASKACYIEDPKNFIWLPKAKDAIKLLNENNVITILVTNQPGIARGNLTESDLLKIHEKMQLDLKQIGARIDYIYYCPHNWDENCFCRKPKPGMLYQAQKDLSLNLTECVLFGDDERDIEAARQADMKGVLVTEEYSFYDAVIDYLNNELS